MAGEFQRSLGLELGGSKNDRTALAVLDFFPKTNRLILIDVEAAHLKTDKISPDDALLETIREFTEKTVRFAGLAVHAPTTWPPYFNVSPKAKSPEAEWMNRAWQNLRPRPKPFLAYLQRPAEIWLRHLTPEKFQIPDGLGSNGAPLAARFKFLAPKLPEPVFEVFPRASVTRLVTALGMSKNIFRLYSDLEKGITFREDFLRGLVKKLPQIFIYEKDVETMILQINCFHAFLGALTQRMIVAGQTEDRPRGFPKPATWIHIPKTDPDWAKVFAD